MNSKGTYPRLQTALERGRVVGESDGSRTAVVALDDIDTLPQTPPLVEQNPLPPQFPTRQEETADDGMTKFEALLCFYLLVFVVLLPRTAA